MYALVCSSLPLNISISDSVSSVLGLQTTLYSVRSVVLSTTHSTHRSCGSIYSLSLSLSLSLQPLPGKQLARYFDHRSETFLNERQKALDKFLKRLAAHPYFSFNQHFKVFLTADTDVSHYYLPYRFYW